MRGPEEYDARYLAGIALFNAGEYFDAHEVWEEVWRDCPAADRRFYQSLIQAAVALYHQCRVNAAGARRLFHSGRSYMTPYRPLYRGLNVDAFWAAVESRLAPTLADPPAAGPAPGPRPTITLDPPALADSPRGSP